MVNHREDMDEKLAVIRHILLHGDREKIHQLEEIIEDTTLLSERVNPIIDHKVTEIKSNFPKVFGEEVGLEFEKKLLLSEDLIVTVISPMLGKLIKKYVTKEIQQLKEKIDTQVKRTFSLKRYYHLVRARMFGIQDSELLLTQLDDYKLDVTDVIIIQRDSGLIMGLYSKDNEAGGDKDIFSGMLTAIKAFGEDAFKKAGGGTQELEFIEYDSNKIFLQSHRNYFFAAIIKGSVSLSEKEKLADKLNKFAEREKKLNLQNISTDDSKYISEKLKEIFD